ncbi:hypothetical protein DPEC_G00031900 [Dallia pectoralis]|uniref:Uncharacterized protein n=1 Tax=Dallia pectoralis TaxID=75939 RepID=A0ACC2HCG7_DALPE|nr:hypothetical protein DPEC_G00031900 [Dallia pectoralis]
MVDGRIVTLILLFCHITATQSHEDGHTHKFSRYTVVEPQLIQRRWTRNADKLLKSGQTDPPDSISYSLVIDDKEHVLHLNINKDFLSPSLVQYSHTANVNPTATFPNPAVHCYYHGHVSGSEDSLVALSTCSGLRGVIVLGNNSYGLEPVNHSSTNEHLLYPLEHSQSEPFFCGVTNVATQTESYSRFDPSHSLKTLLRKKRNLPQTRYIELVLVADNQRYIFKKSNQTAVFDEIVELANLLDGYYKPLNVRVVLVGVEIFTNGNPFAVNGTAGGVLGNFVSWRKTSLLPRVRNDDAQLIVGQPGAFGGGILGMAFVGTVCSASTAGGISVFRDNELAYFSTIMAHELGHNLGMNHDVYPSCTCAGGKGTCIMAASATGASVFSNCSASNFESLVLGGGGVCLLNPAVSTITIATCGNGLLESGEQCDCGTPQECTNKCCNAATCTLTSGSACAQGSCCQNCQIIVSGTPCRSSVNPCDLPEYCNGTAPTCPVDFYVMDGLSCQNNAAYCYEGRCQTYDYQCQHLFTSSAMAAADICFQTINAMGDVYGNCGGTSSANYVKCNSVNAKCGKLQCTNVDVNVPPPGASVSNQIINGASCVNANFNLGTDVRDPGYVYQGSPCSTGNACIGFQCVNATGLRSVNLTCDAQSTCNGRGVCNNLGHCHCNDNWGPPYCDRSGWGGSVDSGPAQIDYSLRNGLLIFFLLVVPILVLLILVLLYVFKRDSLKPCLRKQRNNTSRPGNTTNGQTTGSNAPRQTTPQPPAVPSPPRQPTEAYPSSVTTEPRYQPNSAQTHVPRQGPAGKSTFARSLDSQAVGRGWRSTLIGYDDLIPDDAFHVKEVEDDGVTPQAQTQWKLHRQALLRCLEQVLRSPVVLQKFPISCQINQDAWSRPLHAAQVNQDAWSRPLHAAQVNQDAWSRPLHAAQINQDAWSRPLQAAQVNQDALSRPLQAAQVNQTPVGSTRVQPPPLVILLDDNFYYPSMRYEVYKLARKYCLGFCQVYVSCPVESCIKRNQTRSKPLPSDVILEMAKRMTPPDPQRNPWERNSSTLDTTDGITEGDMQRLMELISSALENPTSPVQDNTEQKEADRQGCVSSVVHKADQACRRLVSRAMQAARENLLPSESMRSMAAELNESKTRFLQDLRKNVLQGLPLNQEEPIDVETAVDTAIDVFDQEKQEIASRYLSLRTKESGI